MAWPNDERQVPAQYSLRRMLLLFLALSVLFSAFASWYWYSRNENYKRSVVYPMGRTFVSSIGYANNRIVFLRLNAIDPHDPMGELDRPWCVPIYMDMYSNDGWAGQCRTFTDSDLGTVVKQHPHIRALDLRSSNVSAGGLKHLAAFGNLEWLWLDQHHCNKTGLNHVREIPALRSLFVEQDDDDPSLLMELRKELHHRHIEVSAASSTDSS